MSADIFRFEEFAGSSRGLIAGPILPSNRLALKSDIALISYSVKNITDIQDVESGNLDVDTVMFDQPQSWNRDDLGYSFLWEAPGGLWNLPNKVYRIRVVFTTTPQLGSKSFSLVWEVVTRDPFQ